MGLRNMTVFTDTFGTEALYVTNGILDPAMCSGGLVLRSTNGLAWERVVTNPLMGCDSRAMTVYNGKLYVAVGGLGLGAQVWATDNPSTIADNWSLVADFGVVDPTNTNVTTLASFNGYLYA
jgi:hypothetical protein